MRLSTVLFVSVIAGGIPIAQAPAQAARVSVGIQLGPTRTVINYNTAQHGDWRANYRQWQPTTVYFLNGQYYERQARGSRAVVVYRKDNDYFLPPQDKKWVGADKRYNYKRKPKKEDYDRGR